MDSRGIPIVIPGNRYSTQRRHTKHIPSRNDIHSFIVPSSKNEQSLLEVYDSFADACFQSHFNHSVLNDDARYNVLEFCNSEIGLTDNTPTRSLACSTKESSHSHMEETLETKVPELQTSEKSPAKLLRSSTFSEEENGLFDTHLLEYMPTTRVTRESIKEDMSTDAQLINFSDMALTSTEHMSMADHHNEGSDIVMGSKLTEYKYDTDNTNHVSRIDSNLEIESTLPSKPVNKARATRKRKSVEPITRLTRSQKSLQDQNVFYLPQITRNTKKPESTSKNKGKQVLNDAINETTTTENTSKTTTEAVMNNITETSLGSVTETTQTVADKNVENYPEKEIDESKRYYEVRKEHERKEIQEIVDEFPGLSHYYEFVERAGRGTFSKVYKAKDLLVDYYMPFEPKYKLESALEGKDANYVAIKLIFNISSPLRVAEEIRYLIMFRESPCITPLITAFRHESYTYLVLPYINFDHFDDFFYDMTLDDIRSYLTQLLTGLECVHEKNVMHRDVKPGNFLYNKTSKIGYLADFGLAQTQTPYHREGFGYLPNSMYDQKTEEAGYYAYDKRPSFLGSRSGTKGFRAPEVVLKYLNQTTAIDIWAVGVILLIILTGRYPFFNPEDDSEVIMELAHLFGMKKLKEFVNYYNRSIQTNIPDIPEEETDLSELCQILNKENIDKWDPEGFSQAIDLLKHCLVLIHTNRYTATEALNHPFLKQ